MKSHLSTQEIASLMVAVSHIIEDGFKTSDYVSTVIDINTKDKNLGNNDLVLNVRIIFNKI